MRTGRASLPFPSCVMIGFLVLMAALLTPIWGYAQQNQQEAYKEFWGTKDQIYRHEPYKVLFFGDSILSGYGILEPEKTIPNQISQGFREEFFLDRDVIFRNMSHPGETTSGAVTRIKNAIQTRPDVIVLAIGANDALRGVDPDVLYNNLNIILKDLARAGIYTLFVGMQAPPSLGYDYMSKFNSVYAKLSEQYSIVFMPFLLEGVAGNRQLNQRDGIHPNADGAEIVAKTIAPYIWRMLENIKKYRRDANDKKRRYDFMIRTNKSRARRNLPPVYSQQQIDAVQ